MTAQENKNTPDQPVSPDQPAVMAEADKKAQPTQNQAPSDGAEPKQADTGEQQPAAATSTTQEETTPVAGEDGPEETAPADTPEVRISKLEDDLLRLRADKENQAKRLRGDIERAKDIGAEHVIRGLLDIADNLERALEQNTDNLKSVQEGVRLTLSQLHQLLESNGIETIEPSPGDKPDPNQHTVILQEKHHTVPPKMIIRTLVKGYRHEQRILRAAHVAVAEADPVDKK